MNGQTYPQDSSQVPSAPSGGMKVIQPISNDIAPSAEPEPVQQAESPDLVAQAPPQDIAPVNPAPIANSIYPSVAKDGTITYPTQTSLNNTKDVSAESAFSEGYATGSTIFFYQFLVGLVLGLIFYGINSATLKAASIQVLAIAGLLHYVVEFFVSAYIPYRVLKDNQESDPLWLTIFGVAVQSIITAVFLVIGVFLVINGLLDHGISSSLSYIGGSGFGITLIVSYIVLLVGIYFLTKLSWGIAFTLFSKIKNKMVFKVIGSAVILLIVSSIMYNYLALRY